ncbi:DNA primase [Patescibacteria group bacterium]|nr:DNA primase [Patescibacteria group bacterium]
MDPVEEIKSRLDIVDVVQEYVPLKPAGTGSFKGLCPFHQEKSPSFFANRARQSWHCFGCDDGGDTISFVMRMEGMEFPEALEHLAQKTGVQLPKFDPAKTTEKKRLHEVNDMAARWFRYILLKDQRAEQARSYVSKRGIDDLTGDLWRIGYAPNEWEALAKALKEKGVKDEEMIKAGLVSKSNKGTGVFDRFRDRIMIPIADIHGNLVGFTGRVLNPTDKEAKYVNTPETALYKKSTVLYGLDKAKGEIKRKDLAVVVEGNMDVVTSHQFGVTNVVASSGTALTNEQLRLIKRFTKNLAIAFDQDSAGTAATIRGLDLARNLDFNIKVIQLPEDAGKDPDDAIRKDVNIWKQGIGNALGFLDWLYQNAFRSRDVARPEEKKMIARDLLPEFKRIADPVERDAWVSRLADDLSVSTDALRDAIRSVPDSQRAKVQKGRGAINSSAEPRTSDAGRPTKSRSIQLDERILAILQIQPDLQPLAENLLKGYDLALETNTDFQNYLAILADREFQDQSPQELEKELRTTAAILRCDHITRERARLEQEMRDAERTGDTVRIKDLLTQFNNL